MPCSGLDSGVLIGIGGIGGQVLREAPSYAAHVATEMGHKFLAQCLSKVAERICSESSRPTWIAKAPANGDSENRLEATLGGNGIKEEFKDTQMDVQKLVEECTVDAKEIVNKCPIFIFGRSRQGKSTLVNNLLKALGKEVRPDGHASVGHMTPCTKGVEMYSCKCSEWTTPGLEEEVILFDSEGWELGKAVDLWSECMKKAKEKKIGQEVLPQRLVLVLVVSASAESRSELADPEFQRLVREVCIQAKQAADKAQGRKPVLVPVVTKSDLLEKEKPDIREKVRHAFNEMLSKSFNKMLSMSAPSIAFPWFNGTNEPTTCGRFFGSSAGIRDMMDVREPMFVASSPEDQEDPEGVLELKRTLSLICKEQLASENILRAVQVSMEKKLLEELKSWEKRGIDSPHSLVRRFLWVVARHCNLRVKNLHEDHPKLTWDAAEAKAAVIRSFKCPKKTNEDTDSYHTDPLRQKHRQPCDPSADLPCREESTSTCTSTPKGPQWDPYLTTSCKRGRSGK
ncbi:unnamed protein product [Durusdinium trenchii]|uniref:G domain-containing protein n=2 Tax=Durusdinium trenchii TaxID=1381693 RepID=A0ABP0SUL0_9DINO